MTTIDAQEQWQQYQCSHVAEALWAKMNLPSAQPCHSMVMHARVFHQPGLGIADRSNRLYGRSTPDGNAMLSKILTAGPSSPKRPRFPTPACMIGHA